MNLPAASWDKTFASSLRIPRLQHLRIIRSAVFSFLPSSSGSRIWVTKRARMRSCAKRGRGVNLPGFGNARPFLGFPRWVRYNLPRESRSFPQLDRYGRPGLVAAERIFCRATPALRRLRPVLDRAFARFDLIFRALLIPRFTRQLMECVFDYLKLAHPSSMRRDATYDDPAPERDAGRFHEMYGALQPS